MPSFERSDSGRSSFGEITDKQQFVIQSHQHLSKIVSFKCDNFAHIQVHNLGRLFIIETHSIQLRLRVNIEQAQTVVSIDREIFHFLTFQSGERIIIQINMNKRSSGIEKVQPVSLNIEFAVDEWTFMDKILFQADGCKGCF